MLSEKQLLLLVNKSHPLPDGWEESVERFPLLSVRGKTVEVEKETLAAWNRLKEDLSDRGLAIGVLSAYRSREDQLNTIRRLTEDYGAEYAAATAAPVGASEHHTGMCLDITAMENGNWVLGNPNLMAAVDSFSRIHERLARHGFILRYPLGKENVTGYGYEPWHIRYVGLHHAARIAEADLTLEEYVESIPDIRS